MGFKFNDLHPLQNQVYTPAGKEHLIRLAQVDRTNTTFTMQLNASLTPYVIYSFVDVASDGTTPTVAISISQNGSVVSTGSVSVAAVGTTLVSMTNFPLIEQLPAGSNYQITFTYSGAGSTVGGPFKFAVEFVQ